MASKSNVYFGVETEDAIFKWLEAPNQQIKDAIFTKEIYPVFLILSEKLVHKFKYYPTGVPYDEVCANIVTHLYERGLPKLDRTRGKAFSYCTRCAINYILANRADHYSKKIKRADVLEIDSSRNVSEELHIQSERDELSIFIDLWIEWYDVHLYELYEKEKHIKIVDAVLEIFKSRKSIDLFQKKLLYILIRERANCNTTEITPIIKQIKAHFMKMHRTYVLENKIELN